MKKNEMNTTANSPTETLETTEATDPTMPLTLLKLTNSFTLSITTTATSKSRPKLGKVAMSQVFSASMGLDSK